MWDLITYTLLRSENAPDTIKNNFCHFWAYQYLSRKSAKMQILRSRSFEVKLPNKVPLTPSKVKSAKM